MATLSEFRAKMKKTEVVVDEYTTKAVPAETAFVGVTSGDWDFETFEAWVSKISSDAYAEGDGDRTYANAMSN